MKYDNQHIIDAYHQAIDASPFAFQSCQSKHHVRINTLSANHGNGFIDLYDFDHLLLSRANLVFCRPQQMKQRNNNHHSGFTIALSGCMQLRYANLDQPIHIRAGEVWWQRGHLGEVEVDLPAQQKIQILSLALRDEWLDQLLQEGKMASDLPRLLIDKSACAIEKVDIFSRVLLKAYPLLSLPSADDEVGLMQLEASAKGLLANIFKANDSAHQPVYQTAIEMAGMILSNECHRKITIRTLAKRVGVNEFTLKSEFKKHYRQTIGEFIREKRMLLALDLLAGGCRLHKVAEQTGYGSTAYFCRVFCHYFGYPPKEI